MNGKVGGRGAKLNMTVTVAQQLPMILVTEVRFCLYQIFYLGCRQEPEPTQP